jgi:diguanylate cyclase (GGDEF)-like protein
MELLWRWSTAVQVSSALMIALFFVVLAQSMRRAELRPWLGAWLANLGALVVTVFFWMMRPNSPLIFDAVTAAYIFCKSSFVLLMVVGAARFARRRTERIHFARLAVFIAIYAIVAAVAIQGINQLGTIQSATIAIVLGYGAILLSRARPPAWAWLATGFAMRAALAAIEAFVYTVENPQSSTLLRTFLASHSSFDTAAEWMMALGCVLMLYRTIQQELTLTNADLLSTQQQLQKLLDHDPLTGLANRRALDGILDRARIGGATLLFFDLNDFKIVNDAYGHQAGDDCLKRFADVLRAHFRADDRIVRYAGDEFVVVAPELGDDQIAARLEAIRADLQHPLEGELPLRFSVGQATLSAGGDAEAALRAADMAMYQRKQSRGV